MTGWDMSFLSDWMIDTFVYTGLLIALVLVLRRPVARHFGPQIAYALWALPLLRLVMPPITLPAWMKPDEAPIAGAVGDPAAQSTLTIFADVQVLVSDSAGVAAPVALAAEPAISLGAVLLPMWLAGAAIFVVWRIRDYIRMRRDLLADVRPVGEAGGVRLVETSVVSAPVAFGVFDKVVALPPGFMALIDVDARDMAIAHELTHHTGNDLLANIAAQPLLALHWFNPLAWWGWRAMRRDQEAACDARVVAGCARSERAAYARVIVGFAAGEHLALAAPMACPVLGEKSIIHRLRSLTMRDISTRRRRIGIAAITTTALALPLTASISYAQPGQDADASGIETVDPDEDQREMRIERHIVRDGDSDENIEYEIERIGDGEHNAAVHVLHEVEDGADGERRIISRITRNGKHEGLTEEETERMMVEVERQLAKADADVKRELADVERQLAQVGHEMEQSIQLAMEHRTQAGHHDGLVVVEEGREGSHIIDVRCDGENATAQQDLSDGRRAMVICNTAIQANAAHGLQAAMGAISGNSAIPQDIREDIIEELARAIQEIESARSALRSLSFLMPSEPPPPARAGATKSRRAPPVPPTPPASIALRWSGRSVPALRVESAPPFDPAADPLAVPHAGEDQCSEASAIAAARIHA
ncbi:hypothetical protein CP97_14735 [Aurantiacibacter atlanticus]|uniref:Peptidase M56 domain-containing protein n=1 Tax=Aurantiacibacter atlanticus TaxID=1648404 RepID=A0A161I466_9SPHN|nr:M56 family metallopeptidase [Aurantiacibacter atlanticus]ANC50421.1 hypothetical protein CP97_14735 [Aurantiacibacter atlanticus]